MRLARFGSEVEGHSGESLGAWARGLAAKEAVMKRVLMIAAAGLTTLAAFRLARRFGPAIKRRVMQSMMNRMMPRMMPRMMASMPKMMDMCFGTMPADQREFMLAHCRGMLDSVEAKYVSTATEPSTSGANVA